MGLGSKVQGLRVEGLGFGAAFGAYMFKVSGGNGTARGLYTLWISEATAQLQSGGCGAFCFHVFATLPIASIVVPFWGYLLGSLI